MDNDYLKFYGERHISPVRQNIDDFDLHAARREKLYRQLGMPLRLFQNAKMLEVGAGGGYNTLCFFHWDAAHIDIVEANQAGINHMRENFTRHKIAPSRYRIFEKKIEDYAERDYDIIIAEGFLGCVANAGEIAQQFKGMVNEKGTIVVTCEDEFGTFLEAVKRMIAQRYVKGIAEYDEKVKVLSRVFGPQLKNLRGASRPVEDWVQDQFLNPAMTNGVKWTMADAVRQFAPEFEVLGCSPQIFSDWSWYKDVWQDLEQKYLKQYQSRRSGLLLAGMEEYENSPEETAEIETRVHAIWQDIMNYEKSYDDGLFAHASREMAALCPLARQMDATLHRVFCQAHDILREVHKEGPRVQWDNYPDFFKAFGRGLQYVSFVKRRQA